MLWEGSAHIVARPGPLSGLGVHLRAALGDGYAAVHIVFGQGHIGGTEVPPPRSDSIEAILAAAGGARVVDLHASRPADVGAALDGPWSTRLISGVCQAEHDHDHYTELSSLSGSFDALVYLPVIAPVGMLQLTGR